MNDDRRRAEDGAPRRRPSSGGRPGYHDPTAGIGGAAPAQSALTLRLMLAVFGFVVSVGAAGALVVVDAPWYLVSVAVLAAAVAVVDAVVVGRRKRRGEPG